MVFDVSDYSEMRWRETKFFSLKVLKESAIIVIQV